MNQVGVREAGDVCSSLVPGFPLGLSTHETICTHLSIMFSETPVRCQSLLAQQCINDHHANNKDIPAACPGGCLELRSPRCRFDSCPPDTTDHVSIHACMTNAQTQSPHIMSVTVRNMIAYLRSKSGPGDYPGHFQQCGCLIWARGMPARAWLALRRTPFLSSTAGFNLTLPQT
jgi:hypothetical protein